MSVSKSGYYDWHKRPANVISLETLKLYRLVRQLFKQSRGSLGNREMVKKLRKEGSSDILLPYSMKIYGYFKVSLFFILLQSDLGQRQEYRSDGDMITVYSWMQRLRLR